MPSLKVPHTEASRRVETNALHSAPLRSNRLNGALVNGFPLTTS
jgi:hypothetical protein